MRGFALLFVFVAACQRPKREEIAIVPDPPKVVDTGVVDTGVDAKPIEGATPIEVTRGELRLVAAHDNRVWWLTKDTLSSTDFDGTTAKVAAIEDHRLVAASPAGAAWLTYDKKCSSSCKATVVAALHGGPASSVVSSCRSTSKGCTFLKTTSLS